MWTSKGTKIIQITTKAYYDEAIMITTILQYFDT